MSEKIGVYPGSFDPVHMGHLDVIERCLPLFDKVIVAVLRNTSKDALFSVQERVEIIDEVITGYDNCRVESFSGLLVDYMKEAGAHTIVRGLRAVSDFESEFQMALMNRRLSPGAETIFLTAREEYSYLASRLVKEVYLLGGNLEGLVPPPVLERMSQRIVRPLTD